MKRIYLSILTIGMIAFGASAKSDDEQPPNLLLLFVDNVGYGDLGCYGNRDAITPRIDRLASEGVKCMDFYIASPSCSPSRGAILTGGTLEGRETSAGVVVRQRQVAK